MYCHLKNLSEDQSIENKLHLHKQKNYFETVCVKINRLLLLNKVIGEYCT